MAYIDAAYYSQTFKGKTVPADAFERLAERASEAVSAMSPYVALNGVSGLEAGEIEAVKKATCSVLEVMAADESGAFSSERIGSYSYAAAKTFEQATVEARKTARQFLDAVGLTYSGEKRRPTV